MADRTQASEGPPHHQHQHPRQPQNLQLPVQPRRIQTGVAGLDMILHGGFLSGSLYIIAGQPGAGKTILGNQMAFNHAASGGQVVYVSLLSESHGHLITHLRSLSFFSEEPIGSSLYYVSGYEAMQKEGLQGLSTLLQGLTRDHQATLLILDGVLNAETFASSPTEYKEFLHRLQVFSEVSGCTVLLLASTTGSEPAASQVPARTTVDGIVELSRKRVDMRVVREIEVQKLRGTGHMEGAHAMQITGEGIQVYPRTEAALLSSPSNEATIVSREIMSFGVPRLDEMLNGGLLARSATVLLGPSGSGKTLLGLTFLAEGARLQQTGLYFGLNEPGPLVIDAADQIGLDFTTLVGPGKGGDAPAVEVMWQPAVEGVLDKVAQELVEAVRRRNVKRLVLDGLESLTNLSAYPGRINSFLTALTNELRRLGVTTITTLDMKDLLGPTVNVPIEGVAGAAENLIFMRTVELHSHLYYLISIMKMRRSGYDTAIREFTIGSEGIKVSGTFESAEAVLTGLARPLHGKRTDQGG